MLRSTLVLLTITGWGLGAFTCVANSNIATDQTCLNSQALSNCQSSLHCDVGDALRDLVATSGTNQCKGDAVVALPIGSACSVVAGCRSSVCTNSICQPGSKNNGDTCTHSEQCSSKKCTGNCEKTYGAGEQCTTTTQCPLNYQCLNFVSPGNVCMAGTAADTTFTCSAHTHCADGFYCSSSTNKCVAAESAGTACTDHKMCATGYCNTNCVAATAAGASCSTNAECGLGSYCDTTCKLQNSLRGACTADAQCSTGKCTNNVCVANTGTQSGNTCTADANCANGLRCFAPSSIMKCARFFALTAACTSDGQCGPGAFCENNTCKKMYIDTFTGTVADDKQCANGNFHSGSCQDVTVTNGGNTLSYPYAGTGTCNYANSATATNTATNGFCPIIKGMAEWTVYLRALVDFYNLPGVQSYEHFQLANYREQNPFNLDPDFAAAGADVKQSLLNIQRHYFNLTHTNLLHNSCSTFLNSTCNRQIPNYKDTLGVSCMGPCNYEFECSTTAHGSGACAELIYNFGSPLKLKFYNNDLTTTNCPALTNQFTLPGNPRNQAFSPTAITAQTVGCQSGNPLLCLNDFCPTVRADVFSTVDCDEGRCKVDPTHKQCKAGDKALFEECAASGECSSGHYCDRPDNTCALADANQSNECDNFEHCHSTRYCNPTTKRCLVRSALNAACSNSYQCTAGNYCKASTCQAQESNGATCTDHSDCSSGRCTGAVGSKTCAAKVGLTTACTAHQDCTSGYCPTNNATPQCSQIPSTSDQCPLNKCDDQNFCNAQNQCEARQTANFACAQGMKQCHANTFCKLTVSFCNAQVSGGFCAPINNYNEQTTICATANNYCASNTCAARLVLDDNCDQDYKCNNAHYCDSTTSKCAAKKDPEQACTRDEMCKDDGYCDLTQGSPGKCKAAIALDTDCTSTNQCAITSYCKNTQKCLFQAQGQFCQRDDDCPRTEFCDSQVCKAQLQDGQACESNEACLVGSECVENICRPIGKALIGQGSFNINEVCESGLQGNGVCVEYEVRDGKTQNLLSYPYPCTHDSTCIYSKLEVQTVTRPCQCLGADSTTGYCPIIQGVKQFTYLRKAIRPLLLAGGCRRALLRNVEMSAELIKCSSATDALKQQAWDVYLAVKYGNFLYKQHMQPCKDSIVAGDSVIAASGSVPTFTIKNEYLFLPPTTPILPTTTRTELDAILRNLGNSFGNDTLKAQNFPNVVNGIIANSSSHYASLRSNLQGKVDGSVGGVLTYADFKKIVEASDSLVNKEANGANYELNSFSNTKVGKIRLVAGQESRITKQLGTDKSIEIVVNRLATDELLAKGAVSYNYMMSSTNPLSPLRTLTPLLEVVCYNAADVRISITNLTNPLTFVFTDLVNGVQNSTHKATGAFFNETSNAWQTLLTLENGRGYFSLRTFHLTTFGLVETLATTTTVSPSSSIETAPVIIAIIGILLLIGLVGGFTILHFMYDERMGEQEKDAIYKAERRLNEAIIQSTSRNNLKASAIEEKAPIPQLEVVDHEKIEFTPGMSDREISPSKRPRAMAVFSPPLTDLYPHLELIKGYSFMKFWKYNVLYVTPLIGACTRRNRLIRNSCFYLIDYFRIIILFALVMSVIYIEEVNTHTNVRVVGIIMGIILMLPSSLYERIVSQPQGPTDITHVVHNFLPNSEGHEQVPRELIGWRLAAGILLFVVSYVIFVILFIVNGAEATTEDISRFWEAVQWTGWGLLAGFIICQVVILLGAVCKANCFRQREQSSCRKFMEIVLVDLRTSLILNDYQCLRLKFS